MAEEYIKRSDAQNCFKTVDGRPMAAQAKMTVWNAREQIGRIPKADVAPVVHGKRELVFDFGQLGLRCSVCKCDFGGLTRAANFCPDCGAKMDLEG